MIAVDTSVVVAAFSTWHDDHTIAAAAVRERPVLPMHAAFEAYSVLTRLPPPHRVGPGVARRLMEAAFAGRLLPLPEGAADGLLGELASLGIAGGATYDAVIAATARAADATIVTLDRRAVVTYDRLGVTVRVLR